ncbi:hypothetical protein TrLO_g727 [Triparma laevis f. longispina]|uniref:Uncharacterized protein n=1 Tax=Triparma laevis f. longispina TaxID=1714387 RepID=A0A9W7DUD8_9STRA|nr:hypothetical protein TrLO_g727 [Triparma laevis f. longispina]
MGDTDQPTVVQTTTSPSSSTTSSPSTSEPTTPITPPPTPTSSSPTTTLSSNAPSTLTPSSTGNSTPSSSSPTITTTTNAPTPQITTAPTSPLHSTTHYTTTSPTTTATPPPNPQAIRRSLYEWDFQNCDDTAYGIHTVNPTAALIRPLGNQCGPNGLTFDGTETAVLNLLEMGGALNFEMITSITNTGALFYFFTDTPVLEILVSYVPIPDTEEFQFVAGVTDSGENLTQQAILSATYVTQPQVEYTIRLSIDNQGTSKLYVDGILLDTAIDTPIVGPIVGPQLRQFKGDIGYPTFQGTISKFYIWVEE